MSQNDRLESQGAPNTEQVCSHLPLFLPGLQQVEWVVHKETEQKSWETPISGTRELPWMQSSRLSNTGEGKRAEGNSSNEEQGKERSIFSNQKGDKSIVFPHSQILRGSPPQFYSNIAGIFSTGMNSGYQEEQHWGKLVQPTLNYSFLQIIQS